MMMSNAQNGELKIQIVHTFLEVVSPEKEYEKMADPRRPFSAHFERTNTEKNVDFNTEAVPLLAEKVKYCVLKKRGGLLIFEVFSQEYMHSIYERISRCKWVQKALLCQPKIDAKNTIEMTLDPRVAYTEINVLFETIRLD